jgi:hypothetical protein
MFVGQRKDPFVVNLGETFDLINLSNPLGPVDGEKDSLADKNVTSLILELPKSCLTNGSPVIAGWTTASQFQGTNIVQVSRLGQPLVNEVVIGLKDKDTFNASQPKDDAQFAKYVTNPTLPALIELLFGSAGVRAPTNFPRTDLVTVFLTGVPGLNQTTATAELLRLNTSTPALAAASQNNLGVIAGDVAGFPNGRRPGDDVVDIALRVVMGKLLFANDAPSGQLPFTDGALLNAGMFQQVFPYLNPPLVDVQAVNALAVLPDGTVLLGGQFNLASAPTSLTCVAYWTGTNWASLGVGVNNTVISLTVLDKNSFVAAGAFLMAGGHHASRIARWDGAGWDFYGSGFSQPGAIGAFARMPNGDIIAGGDFTGAGTVDATNVARWNGHSWSSLGLSADGAVRALAVLTNGDLVVGGKFSVVNGFPASNLARWDGANWSAPAPDPGDPVSSLAVMPNGDLIVGGMLSNVGSSNITGVARWDGTNWSGMGAGLFDTYA